ncbi:MAG: class I SAM-dependent methyltransferase [Phycisphaerales bacterium]|nr:class I SAM-dependent methyltransferase [Phycisphaerales bacterium]
MASTRSGLYDDPEIYDILHAPGTRAEVDGLEAIEGRYVDRSRCGGARRWLEPACGSGRYIREAARRGIEAVGFDLSPGMIEYARRHAGRGGRGGRLLRGEHDRLRSAGGARARDVRVQPHQHDPAPSERRRDARPL